MNRFGALIFEHYKIQNEIYQEVKIICIDSEYFIYLDVAGSERIQLPSFIVDKLEASVLFTLLEKEANTLIDVIIDEKTRMERVVINIEEYL